MEDSGGPESALVTWSHCAARSGLGTGVTSRWVLVPWGTFEAARVCQADAHQGQDNLGGPRCALGLRLGWEANSILQDEQSRDAPLKLPGCRGVREGIVTNLACDF